MRHETRETQFRVHEMEDEMGKTYDMVTAVDLSKELGKSVERIGQKFRAFREVKHPHFTGPFNRAAALTPVQVAYLKGEVLEPETETKESDVTVNDLKSKVGEPNWGPSNVMAPETVTKQKTDFRALFFQIVCVLIVVFHAGLIAYDVAFLWGIPGMIAGGLAFLTVIATLIICTDKKQEDVSQDMVWFVWLIDAAAGVVHYRTFNFAVSVKGGMGVERVETIAFAVFTCLFSAAALYFFRASQFKNLSK